LRESIRFGLLIVAVILLFYIGIQVRDLGQFVEHKAWPPLEASLQGSTGQAALTLCAARAEEGRLLASDGHLEEALAAYGIALEVDPSNVAARTGFEICAVLQMAREPDRCKVDPSALRYFATRYQAKPVDGITAADASVALGNLALYVDGDTGTAEALYQQVLQDDAANFYAHVGVANVEILRSKGKGTGPLLDLLLAESDGVKVSRPAAETIARLALINENFSAAVSFATAARAQRPTAGNLTLLTQAQLASKKFEEAVATASQLVAVNPKEATGYQMMCQALTASEKFAQAASSCAVAFELGKDPADQILMGRSLSRIGRDGEAIDAYKKALEKTDRHLGAYLELGEIYKRVGDLRGAAWALGRLAGVASSTGEPLPGEIEKLRDEARQRLEALGPVPGGPDKGPQGGKPRR